MGSASCASAVGKAVHVPRIDTGHRRASSPSRYATSPSRKQAVRASLGAARQTYVQASLFVHADPTSSASRWHRGCSSAPSKYGTLPWPGGHDSSRPADGASGSEAGLSAGMTSGSTVAWPVEPRSAEHPPTHPASRMLATAPLTSMTRTTCMPSAYHDHRRGVRTRTTSARPRRCRVLRPLDGSATQHASRVLDPAVAVLNQREHGAPPHQRARLRRDRGHGMGSDRR